MESAIFDELGVNGGSQWRNQGLGSWKLESFVPLAKCFDLLDRLKSCGKMKSTIQTNRLDRHSTVA